MSDIITDTETSGLAKVSFAELKDQPRIIQFAAIVVSDKGEIIETYEEIFNPEVQLSEELKEKFGWDEEELKTKRLFKEAIPHIRNLFYKAPHAAMGHNQGFDEAMLKYELQRAICDYFPWPKLRFDTVHEFRHLFGYRPNLKQLYEKIMGKELNWTHRALEDAMAVYEILKHEGWWS